MALPLATHYAECLLSSLEGYAIIGVRIEGVDHEFATIKGISEDVVEIILNLKQVRFKKKTDGDLAQEKGCYQYQK